MAKNLKINIKNTQIAKAINLGGIKEKLAKKKAGDEVVSEQPKPTQKAPEQEAPKEESPRIKARSKSVFDKENVEARVPHAVTHASTESETHAAESASESETPMDENEARRLRAKKARARLEDTDSLPEQVVEEKKTLVEETSSPSIPHSTQPKEKEAEKPPQVHPYLQDSRVFSPAPDKPAQPSVQPPTAATVQPSVQKPATQSTQPAAHMPQEEKKRPPPQYPPNYQPRNTPPHHTPAARPHQHTQHHTPAPRPQYPHQQRPYDEPRVKLGPTGQHMRDLVPPRPPRRDPYPAQGRGYQPSHGPRPPQNIPRTPEDLKREQEKLASKKQKAKEGTPEDENKNKLKAKEFRDVKPLRRTEPTSFDARDRHGLRAGEEETHYRKRKPKMRQQQQEDVTIRPTTLAIRVPITVKDLANEMKLKASEVVSKLFINGIIMTLNDRLEDPTTIQLIGSELGCEITIDTKEEERIRITDKTVQDEIRNDNEELLKPRAPVVAFMGHVDHGKTSLIDAIRKSKRAAGEAGAITQHIGAFRCSTSVGDIAILDTPGHEAFSAMRARGANVTDIAVLVVAGDEGLRQQTIEAMNHAREAKNTIVVAINKSDKPNYNPDNVYRQLAENELLPEVWGGQTITVNCSAVTGEGIEQLLELLALQAEVLELRANPEARARGSVLESEMHKGMGAVATVLVQNGTLHLGDALVCDAFWGRVKTMQDEFGRNITEAGPSTPVEITGLSGLPEAGSEFIIVKSEKEARNIAEARLQGEKQRTLQMAPKFSLENIFQKASETAAKKIYNIILRADVQGSLEAIKAALMKIKSNKVDLNVVFAGVGEISESDVQMAAISKATIVGFHTKIESHADSLVKQLGITVKLHDIIYHAIDDVKALMASILDKIAQEEYQGKAEIKAVFKSSHHGLISGCQVIDGTVHRNDHVRLIRNNEAIWKGTMVSLKRVKEDVREVTKGLECGILLNGFNESQPGDIIEAYQVVYITQEL